MIKNGMAMAQAKGQQPVMQGAEPPKASQSFEETKTIGGKTYGRRGGEWYEVK